MQPTFEFTTLHRVEGGTYHTMVHKFNAVSLPAEDCLTKIVNKFLEEIRNSGYDPVCLTYTPYVNEVLKIPLGGDMSDSVVVSSMDSANVKVLWCAEGFNIDVDSNLIFSFMTSANKGSFAKTPLDRTAKKMT